MPWLRLGTGLGALALGLWMLARALSGSVRRLAGLRSRAPLAAAAAGGAVGSALLQSSSMCVAALVAAADAGAITLPQAWAAIAGANIGTTLLPQVTAWTPPWLWLGGLALAGAALGLPARSRRIGLLALGGAVLLTGFRLISGAFGPGGLPVAAALERAGTGTPGRSFVAGALLTALLFSSHFTIGVAQGLAAAGVLHLRAGIAFVCGANLGTTADVLAASLGTGRRGRLAAAFHLAFNGVLAALGLVLLGPLALALAGTPPARALAHGHTALNVLTAAAVYPAIVALGRRLRRGA